MKVGIIGLGLMGGSFSYDMRELYPDAEIFGLDLENHNFKIALKTSIIDSKLDIKNIYDFDIILVAIPVDKSIDVLKTVLDNVSEKTLVIDVGSTKEKICRELKNHPNRKNFLATHPISGTENSGPYAAKKHIYFNITNIICEPELTSPDLLKYASSLFDRFNMNIINMDPASHDQHISYVSHLSHITSFILAKTVIQKEKNEKNIFDLAGSGFESTVRLAKSSSEMWTPIFLQNKDNILEALNGYINNLKELKKLIIKNDKKSIINDLNNINRVKKILSGINNKKNEK
jgi:prephenate dehydrogenase|tara:strand:- start:10199 stop:11065 length:867 start_codon:yes stop_codon:yes gene_type:complete